MTVSLTHMPVIETERLILRGPKPADWAPWRDFAMSGRARFIGGPYALGGAWRAFCHVSGMWAMRGIGSFVVTYKGHDNALGMTGPWVPADWPEPELGWTMWRDDLEGTGLMFEAAVGARDYAFETLGWTTAVSYIHAENKRSIRLAERLGAHRDDAAERPHPEDLVYRHSAEAVT
ncbi:MAG: GNAT family N-acetyltransferase [Pseudomonadota bacterium]